MKHHGIEWRNDYLILVAIILVALAVVLLPGWIPVQAATPLAKEAPLPPDICLHVATAETTKIFWCENPYNGVRFYTAQLAFLMPEEQ